MVELLFEAMFVVSVAALVLAPVAGVVALAWPRKRTGRVAVTVAAAAHS